MTDPKAPDNYPLKKAEPWSFEVGIHPHRVTVYEDPARGNVVHLRWREGKGTYPRRSLGFTVRSSGRANARLDVAAVTRAQKAAEDKYRELMGVVNAPSRAMTLAEGLESITDPERGQYPKKSAHRKEIERCMRAAMAGLGRDYPFTSVSRGDIRMLWRRELSRQRAKGRSGHRAAELVVGRLFLVANWLRNEELIPAGACQAWKEWKVELLKDCGEVVINRPRFTIEELRALLAAAPAVDPRFALMYSWGAELRPGQVRRLRRSQVSLDVRDKAPLGAFVVKGEGKKRGTLVVMTKTQRASFDKAIGEGGYLAGLEAARIAGTIADYPMFPGGKIESNKTGLLTTVAKHATREPIDMTIVRMWFRKCQRAAGVAVLPGRGWYGGRRAGVDAAKELKISREGMRQFGGWSDNQVPDMVYADQEMLYASAEAADVRSRLRGEEP